MPKKRILGSYVAAAAGLLLLGSAVIKNFGCMFVPDTLPSHIEELQQPAKRLEDYGRVTFGYEPENSFGTLYVIEQRHKTPLMPSAELDSLTGLDTKRLFEQLNDSDTISQIQTEVYRIAEYMIKNKGASMVFLDGSRSDVDLETACERLTSLSEICNCDLVFRAMDFSDEFVYDMINLNGSDAKMLLAIRFPENIAVHGLENEIIYNSSLAALVSSLKKLPETGSEKQKRRAAANKEEAWRSFENYTLLRSCYALRRMDEKTLEQYDGNAQIGVAIVGRRHGNDFRRMLENDSLFAYIEGEKMNISLKNGISMKLYIVTPNNYLKGNTLSEN